MEAVAIFKVFIAFNSHTKSRYATDDQDATVACFKALLTLRQKYSEPGSNL
jgi:hypothetical protein